MKQYSNFRQKYRKHHSRTGFGFFLIALGIALLVATNDMLHLGSINEYFTWETAMIFVGILLILNLSCLPGTFMVAGGVWFLYENHLGGMSHAVKTFYWPSVAILAGISLIIVSLFKRKKHARHVQHLKQTNI
ncbi:MAG: hypothetical protein GX158_11705 [Bacteroidales bacterium]|jgi:hypothetical protein|nr:hypothetical protein [Bacteroidales bacterium]